LKTGDKGVVDADGYLTITGRVKDQFKTDKAKFIAPAPIEMKFTSNKDIDSICVVGMGIPQPIALVVLSGLATGKSKTEIVEGLQTTLDIVNATLEHYERIEKVVVLSESWTIENGFITPSLKVKRHEIEKVHAASYIDWYKQKDKILWA
jgi:long-chain acyl-CoA synthetase